MKKKKDDTIIQLYKFFVDEVELRNISNEINYYNELNSSLEKEKEEIKGKITQTNNYEYIESVARNKLDMFLPNETVYIFGE